MSITQRAQHPLFHRIHNKVAQYGAQFDNELSEFPTLISLEQHTQVPKIYVVLSALVLGILLHTVNMFAAPISNVIGWCLPAYLSYNAVETPSSPQAVQWVAYWVILNFLSLMESLSLRLVLYYVPWYFTFKSLFVIWLQLRATYPSFHPMLPPLREKTQQDDVHNARDDPRPIEEIGPLAPDQLLPNSTPLGLIEEASSNTEKKYFKSDKIFIKRSLDQSELHVLSNGNTYADLMYQERIRNEVAVIRYIQRKTNIPVPNIRCAFEDNGRFYIITDIVPGVRLVDLPLERKAGPIREVEGYVAQMHSIKSRVMGGISGDNILPFRVTEDYTQAERLAKFSNLKFRDAPTPEFVFCHNDLSQYNVMVDEQTLRVTAILDWEYAGFYPAEFDAKFYLRTGPSVALEGEEDDVPKLMEVLEHWKA